MDDQSESAPQTEQPGAAGAASSMPPCETGSVSVPGALAEAAPAASRPRLSKAEKRQLKNAWMKERRQMWRQRTKEGHKEKVRKRAEERASHLAAMTAEEREAFQSQEAAERERLYREKVAQTARLDEAHAQGQRVVLDLSYSGEMDDKEQRSLSRQLARCWGANRRAAAPVSLHISSLGRCPKRCLPENDDHLRWKVHLLQEDLIEHFGAAELVFLSPDAQEVLTELEPSTVYVIGGLVDRSVKKQASLSRASALGARCMRLPLREHAPDVNNARLPLTLCAVLEILLEINRSNDWTRAVVQALPARKEIRPVEQSRAVRRAQARAQREAAKLAGASDAAESAADGEDGSEGESEDSEGAEDSDGVEGQYVEQQHG